MIRAGVGRTSLDAVDAPIVRALGHAGLQIDGPGVRLLADPWVSSTGAFLGSWFPFPDNSHVHTPELYDADVVVVSHEHLDHLDLGFLAGLPAGVPVVVPRYPSTILQRRLAAIGRDRVVTLDAWSRFPLPGGWLTVIPEQCPMSHDSAVLVHLAGHTILHTNDARISVAQLRRAMAEVGGRIDVMGLQMSGASWHPVCYELAPEERARVEEIKRIGKFKAGTRLARMAAPRMVLPYAGPPCFLDEELFEHNGRLHGSQGVFPDQDEAAEWLRRRLPDQVVDYLLPGDALDAGDLTIARDPHWAGFSLASTPAERRKYLSEYAARRAPEIQRVWEQNPEPEDDARLGERFAAHMRSLGTLSEYFLARIGMTLRFEVQGPAGGTWDVHLGPGGVDVDLDGGAAPCAYRLRMESRWLAGVVEGRTRWEELLLSLRFSAHRDPDRYNDYLVGLLKHADLAALRAVEEHETRRDLRETMRVAAGGRQLEVGRYCPHAGEDLAETGIVLGDRMRCLGHNFEFDLRTGDCVNARCEPLLVRSVDEALSS
jgi:UDP-MurNAc hydroxylase